jgi:hypothetical protein
MKTHAVPPHDPRAHDQSRLHAIHRWIVEQIGRLLEAQAEAPTGEQEAQDAERRWKRQDPKHIRWL